MASVFSTTHGGPVDWTCAHGKTLLILKVFLRRLKDIVGGGWDVRLILDLGLDTSHKLSLARHALVGLR